jgi:hypothetical protein
MIVDEDSMEDLNNSAYKLYEKLDDTISNYVEQDENDMDENTPVVILAAISIILTKLTLIMDEPREAILGILDTMMPENEDMQSLKLTDKNNVFPITRNLH